MWTSVSWWWCSLQHCSPAPRRSQGPHELLGSSCVPCSSWNACWSLLLRRLHRPHPQPESPLEFPAAVCYSPLLLLLLSPMSLWQESQSLCCLAHRPRHRCQPAHRRLSLRPLCPGWPSFLLHAWPPLARASFACACHACAQLPGDVSPPSPSRHPAR